MQYILSNIRQWELRDLAVFAAAATLFLGGYAFTAAVAPNPTSLMQRGARASALPPNTGEALTVSEATISFNVDQGFASAYQNARPIFEKAGFPATWYVIPSRLGAVGYINAAQVRELQKDGNEIGTTGYTHTRLSGLVGSKLHAEIEGAKKALEEQGISADTFAYPRGDADGNAVDAVIRAGFLGARTLEGGRNGELDVYRLKALKLGSNTTFDEVKKEIDAAVANKEWLILVLSRVDEEKTSDGENISHLLLQRIVSYVSGSGARVATVHDVLESLSPAP